MFAGKVMTSYSSNWFTLLLLCTSAPLVLCCDRFDHCSRRAKREPVEDLFFMTCHFVSELYLGIFTAGGIILKSVQM